MQHQNGVQALRLLGGRLCLDFVNTIENRTGENPEDLLTSYPDLGQWSRHAGLLTDDEVKWLIDLAATDEPGARHVFQQALELREALYRVFLAIANQHDPDPADLEQVTGEYERAIAGAHLIAAGDHFAWNWRPPTPHLDQIPWPVAFSAVELLTEGELRRVKVCANPDGCGWLFYDSSKNASRRWCSMEGCGSRIKMRRQYAKRRKPTS